MFKNKKVQLNLTGWKTRGDIFTEKDVQAINATRKMYEYNLNIISKYLTVGKTS